MGLVKLRLWCCTHLTAGTETPCDRSVYVELDAPVPECPHEPEVSYIDGHGTEHMIDKGVYEFEGVS